MSSRVDRVELLLSLESAAASRSVFLRGQVERKVLPRILERCEARVHERFSPQAILAVRRLSVTWVLDEKDLEQNQRSDALGEQMADELMEQLQDQNGPHPQAGVVLFRSEAHRRAVLLQERTRGVRPDAWYHSEPPDRPLLDWLSQGRAATESLLEELALLRVDAEVARALPSRTVRELAQVLPPQSWPTEFAAAAAVHFGGADSAAQLPTDSWSRASWPASSEPQASADWLDLLQGGRAQGGHSVERVAPSVPVPRSATVLSPQGEAVREVTDQDELPSSEPAAKQGLREPAMPQLSSAQVDGAPELRSRASQVLGERPDSIQQVSREPHAHGTKRVAQQQEGGLEVLGTRYAGLFYLVHVVQDLKLAQALWQVGAREGEVLAHTAALMIGERDPASAVFGGLQWEAELPACAPLEPWALQELSQVLEGAVGVKLKPLAALWRRTIQCDSESTKSLLALCAAALSWRFRSSLGLDPWVTELPWLSLRGRLLFSKERLIVVMPMSAIDMALRVAGLDQNPGWAPWLERRVELVFEGGEQLW